MQGSYKLWAFKNNNTLLWSRLVVPSRVFYLKNTSMVRRVCPIIWYAANLSEGWWFAVLHALVFSIYGNMFTNVPYPSIPILLLHLKPTGAFSYPHPNPNSTKFLFPTIFSNK